MSLVNDMLRDLEQRNEPSSPVPGSQSGVKAAQYVEARHERSPLAFRMVIWAVGIAALSASAWLLWQDYRPQIENLVARVMPQTANQSSEVVVTPVTADTPTQQELAAEISENNPQSEQTEPVVVTSEVAIALANANAAEEPVVIDEVLWSGIEIGGDLVVKLSGDADVQVLEQTAERMLIAFDHVQFDGDLPVIDSPLIRDLALERDNERILLTLQAARSSQFSFRLQQTPTILILGVRADEFELSQATDEIIEQPPQGENAQATEIAAAEEPLVEPRQVTKAKAPLSDKQVFRRASVLIDQGKLEQAENLLSKRLRSHSRDALSSRNLLTTLFLMQGDIDAAQTQINAGLELHPNDAGLKKLQGRVWIAQGRFEETLVLLEQGIPAIADDTEYHELLATAYQQQQADEAVNIYYSLLQFNRSVSRWWIGLGYSLELAQRNSEAQGAYENALNLPNIEPELRAYAQQRLNALAG